MIVSSQLGQGGFKRIFLFLLEGLSGVFGNASSFFFFQFKEYINSCLKFNENLNVR